MQPTPKSAHKDAALTNLAIGYRPAMFVSDRIAPYVPVKKQSDYFFKFLKGAWFRNEARMRGPGAIAGRGGYPLTSDTYSCKEYAFGHPVPIELVNNADSVLTPFATGVKYAMRKVLLAKEVIVSTAVMTSGNWTSSNDVGGGWAASTGTSNTFIEDILAYKETIRQLIGVYPNKLLIEAKTFKELKMCDDIIDRIKYTGTSGKPADVSTLTIAQLLDLDEVMVAGGIYSDAEEVVAGTDWNAVDMWEVNATKGAAFLYYTPPPPAIDEPSAAYCFNWKGDAGQESSVAESDLYRTVRYWWEDAIKSWIVEASEYFDFKVTCADAGCLFYDTIVN